MYNMQLIIKNHKVKKLESSLMATFDDYMILQFLDPADSLEFQGVPNEVATGVNSSGLVSFHLTQKIGGKSLISLFLF